MVRAEWSNADPRIASLWQWQLGEWSPLLKRLGSHTRIRPLDSTLT